MHPALVQDALTAPVNSNLHLNNEKKKKIRTKMMHINSMAFGDRIGIELNRFRKAYKDLKWETRIARTDLICSVIIAACIDKDEEDKNYYIENEEFGHDVLNIVNCIKDRLSIKLKLDLNAIAQPEICNLIEDDVAGDDGSKVTEAFKMAQNKKPTIYLHTPSLLALLLRLYVSTLLILLILLIQTLKRKDCASHQKK